MDFADPEKNIGLLGVYEGEVVADFGAGSGAYAKALTRKVGESGKVYAIDVQKDVLARLKRDADSAGLSNLEIIWADLDGERGTGLREDLCDAVIMSNILFQSENKSALAKEALRILKVGGKLMVIDWSESFGNLGPISDHVVTEEMAISILTEAGFKKDSNFNAGAHHWGAIFIK